jgi:O-antigen/teichoic acid export membrane protein
VNKKLVSLSLMASSISNAMLQFFVMVFVARIAGSEATGEYALAQSYILPVMFLGMFGLRQQALMDAEGQFDGSDFFAVRTLYATSLFVIAIAVVALFETPSIVAIAAAFAVVKMLDGYTDITVGIMQRAGRYKLLAGTSLLRMIAGSAAFYVVFRITENVPFALLAMACVLALNTIIFEYRRCRRMIDFKRKVFTRHVDAKSARKALLRFGLPLGASMVISNLQLSGVRIILEAFQTPHELAYFSVIMQLISVGLLVIASVGNAYIPSMQRAFVARDARKFTKIFVLLSGIVIGCVMMGAVLILWMGDWLITSIFGEEFAGLQTLLLVSCIAAVPFYLCNVAAQACTACKLSRSQFWVNIIGLAIVMLLSWLLIPLHATYGAFYALAGGLMVQMVAAIGTLVYVWRRPIT